MANAKKAIESHYCNLESELRSLIDLLSDLPIHHAEDFIPVGNKLFIYSLDIQALSRELQGYKKKI